MTLDIYTNSLDMQFVKIPSGTFTMGASEKTPWYFPWERQHDVTISHDFYMQNTLVTQEQWLNVMEKNLEEQRNKSNPDWSLKGQGATYPIYFISWFEANIFIKALNRIGEGHYRLPTESEWEYACRAGSSTLFSFGDDRDSLGDYAWYCENSEDISHPVAQKKANQWGLYDMHGLMMEWCQDIYEEYPEEHCIDPRGPAEGIFRVIRGGGWSFNSQSCRSAFRYCVLPAHRANVLSMRLVKDA